MQTPQQEGGDTQNAPRSGASAVAVPLLVNKPINATSPVEVEEPERSQWTKKQKRVRRVCRDRLRYWQNHGYDCLWVTLTSGVPSGPQDDEKAHKRLRLDFAELRKRISRKWSYSPFEYVCVETAEGNGVLHMLWALATRRGAFYVPQSWLSEQWQEIHGAWNVHVSRISSGEKSRSNLSRYIVTQYCGGQDALVRLSQSRLGFPFAKVRRALLAAVRACTDRFLYLGRITRLGAMATPEAFGRICGQWYWLEIRQAWEELIDFGVCEFFGCKHVWFLGELRAV